MSSVTTNHGKRTIAHKDSPTAGQWSKTPEISEPNGIPETVTVRQAAGLLHSSVRQVQNLMYSGVLAYYKPSHNKVLISLDSIRALFATPANSAVLHN